jgi:hypothetical protein
MQDRNCNGRADETDIALGQSADCQPNGIPDEAETNLYSALSGRLSPIEDGTFQLFVVRPPLPALGPVLMILRARADLDSPSEYIDVDIDMLWNERAFESQARGCPADADGAYWRIPAETYNEMARDGDVAIRMWPSPDVGPCAPPSYIEVILEHESNNDVDGDGEPDCIPVGIPETEHAVDYRLRIEPNPIQPSAEISYALPRPGGVEIRIWNVAGRTVRRIRSGHLPAGTHGCVWDGRDDSGLPVGSGVYFVVLRVDGTPVAKVQKVSLVR